MKRNRFTPAYKSIEDLVPYQTGKPIEELAREKGLTRIIKMASNENPMGMSKRAREAAVEAASGVYRYPDGGAWELKGRLAEKHGVSRNMIVLGNGSNEILELLAQLLLSDNGETLYAWPAFIVYRLATMAHGGKGIEVPLNSRLEHDLDAMAEAVTPETRIAFVANPNNPPGTYLPGDAIEKFMDSLPEEVLFVLDEAYFEYAEGLKGFPDGMDYILNGRQIVVTRTFSKAYGLAGMRIGYGVMPEPLAELLNKVRQPFNVNSIAQAAALAALEDEDFVRRSVALNRKEMERMTPALEDMGLSIWPSATNFLLIDLKERSGTHIYQGLLDQGVIVRSMAPYGLPETIRVTVGLPEENDLFLECLTKII